MRRWRIPAKTFLLGEYSAMRGESAIIATTGPCFEMTLLENQTLENIHPQSPAGQWWTKHALPNYGLNWHDPYEGIGGLGASSAQFLGAYLASCQILRVQPDKQFFLEAYFQSAWNGEGLRPSGYDVLAQSQNQCVYINMQNKKMESLSWPFPDIAFILLHSGQKLATHYHLQTLRLPLGVEVLSPIVEQAKQAFDKVDTEAFVDAINTYHNQLLSMNLIAKNSREQIDLFNADKSTLAAKGCGAMGADILLLIVSTDCITSKIKTLKEQGWKILGTNRNLYQGKSLVKNNSMESLEIMS
jgi:mevalonate kinase